MQPDDELVEVARFTMRRQAEVAHSALEAFEVPSLIKADDLGGVGPGVEVDEGVQLLVRPEDVERARDVLTPTATPRETRE